jgi:hypothetical protein
MQGEFQEFLDIIKIYTSSSNDEARVIVKSLFSKNPSEYALNMYHQAISKISQIHDRN